MTFKSYESADGPELCSTVLMNTQKAVIISLPIEDVQPGDILVYFGEMELTNNTDQWARFSRSMILASGPVSNTGEKLTESNEENFNPKSYWVGRSDVHHLAPLKGGIHTVVKPIPKAYVNLLAWSATDPPQPNYALTVEKGYGRVSVLKIRS
jgi:hypothetical protein